jgi:hypothetical protein
MQPLVPLLNGGEPEGAVLVWGILNYNVARLKGDPASRRWKGFLDAVRTTDTARMGRLYQLRALTAWRAPEEQLVYDGFVEALQWLERAPSFRRET